MIEVRNLSKRYGDVWALKNASWKVENRRTLGLLGPNGAGKSTSMKIMTGILCATEGSVCMDGKDVVTHPQEIKRKIGFLPESPPVYEELTVESYLEFVAGLKGMVKRDRKLAIDSVVEKLSLQDVQKKYIGQLSKGFRQRVGIAQALINDPPFLVLDEPSVGLDPQQVFELRQLIQSLKNDHTIILSTHVLSEVQQICDDVVIINKGEVTAQGPIDEVISRIQNRHGLKLRLQSVPGAFVEDLRKLPQVQLVNTLSTGLDIEVFAKGPIDCIDDYIQVALKHDCGILDIDKYQAHLEDAYIQLTQEGSLQ